MRPEDVSELENSPQVPDSQSLNDVDRLALIGLAEANLIDCGRVVQLIQLMMMPEFDRFFSALCEIEVADCQHVGETLADCAEEFAHHPVSIADVVTMAMERVRSRNDI